MNDLVGTPGKKARDGSQSKGAPNFYPNFLRYLWFDLRLFVVINIKRAIYALALIAVGIWLVLHHYEIYGYIALAIALVPLYLIYTERELYKYKRDKVYNNYRNGLITAAVVESLDLCTLIHIANIGTKREPYLYGIMRKKYAHFPANYEKLGMQIPVSSSFVAGDRPRTWTTYDPKIIAFGTSDESKIKSCLKQAQSATQEGDQSYFDILNKYQHKQNPMPDFDQLFVCDKDGNLVEKRTLDHFDLVSFEEIDA